MRSGPMSLVVLLLTVGAGCERDPIDTPCPDVQAGGLVLSELRGAQSSADSNGQWVEVYNASGRAVSLGGLALTMRRLDGGAEVRIMVRSETEQVAAGGYAVLGRFSEGNEPAHVTYGYLSDLEENLYTAAELILSACGLTLDRVVYRSLPTSGSLGFDGGRTLDAAANDTESAWCADAMGDGRPGTPLMRNRPCAP